MNLLTTVTEISEDLRMLHTTTVNAIVTEVKHNQEHNSLTITAGGKVFEAMNFIDMVVKKNKHNSENMGTYTTLLVLMFRDTDLILTEFTEEVHQFLKRWIK